MEPPQPLPLLEFSSDSEGEEPRGNPGNPPNGHIQEPPQNVDPGNDRHPSILIDLLAVGLIGLGVYLGFRNHEQAITVFKKAIWTLYKGTSTVVQNAPANLPPPAPQA
jgi:hypothetical protein